MGQSLVIIDSRVTDYQTLIDGLTDQTAVYILDGESDGLSQIATKQRSQAGIDTPQMVSQRSRIAQH